MSADALSHPATPVTPTRSARYPELPPWRRRLRRSLFATGLYQSWLRRAAPAAIAWTPAAILKGSADAANAMFQGRYTFAGHTVQSAKDAPWRQPDMPPGWLAACHEFGWLTDFAAADGATARKQARELVRRWIADFGKWSPSVWRADTLGTRLVAWLTHADFLLVDAEPEFGGIFLRSIGEQLRHLGRAHRATDDTVHRIVARSSYVIATIAVGRRVPKWDRMVAQLIADTRSVTDGVATRCPGDLLRVLPALVGLRAALEANRKPAIDALADGIAAVAAILRVVMHGDGRLAVFHGSQEGSEKTIAALLAHGGRRPTAAGAAGFARLQQGRLLAIAETAAPGPSDGYAATLALEVSIGKERLFVNCGRPDNDDAAWQAAARATAAHSTLVVDDRNQDPTASATAPQVLRGEEGDSVWLDLSSHAYAHRFGVRLARRLYIAKDGHELVCEEQVFPAVMAESAESPGVLCARYHLHPKVAATPLGSGRQILLKLGNGTGWVFEVAEGTADLEDSVYFGDSGKARRTRQIVITRPIDARSCRVMWHLMRLDGRV